MTTNVATFVGASSVAGLLSSAPVPLPTALVSRANDIESTLPHCAIPCFQQYCASYDDTCLCGLDKDEIDKCVLVSCSLPESIFARNVTETTCHTPVRNRIVKFNTMIIAMSACTLVFIIARLLYTQFFSAKRRLNTEDWTIILAVALGLPSIGLTIFGLTAHGMGKDVWGLERSNLIAFGRYFYAIQIIYILLMLLVKLTLTFFYLNIFLGRGIRMLLWATVIFHVAAAISFTVVIITQCLPISFQWEKYNFINDDTVQGHCFNINVAGWANSALNVASDIWLLAIPLFQIHKLNLHWKKKMGAALMFLTGASVTVVSFLRLASVRLYASTSNPTWDQWDIVWWSTIEVEVGLICTCLPAIRLILVRLAPQVFGAEPGNSTLTLNRISSRSTRHTRLDEDEEAALPNKRSSTLAASSCTASPKQPEATAYSWRVDSHSSGSMGTENHHDVWHEEDGLQPPMRVQGSSIP